VLDLEAGARVIFDGVDDIPGRSSVSQGTVEASAVGLGFAYFPGGRIPAEPWRALTQAEHAVSCGDASAEIDWSRTVLVTRVPDRLMQRLAALELERFHSLNDCARLYQEPRFAPTLAAFHTALVRRHARSTARIRPLGLTFHPPALPTVASDVGPEQRRLRIGLHVDHADLTPEHTQSTNRIAVNAGHEDRYLLMINQTLQAMQAKLGLEGPAHRANPDGVAMAFMRAFPGYPVTRIRIRPGEAYIAPTDNLIHDGSTLGATRPCPSVHLIGDFGLALGA
jgi:hypothetical protein